MQNAAPKHSGTKPPPLTDLQFEASPSPAAKSLQGASEDAEDAELEGVEFESSQGLLD